MVTVNEAEARVVHEVKALATMEGDLIGTGLIAATLVERQDDHKAPRSWWKN